MLSNDNISIKNCVVCETPLKRQRKRFCSRACQFVAQRYEQRGENNPNYRNARSRICETCGEEYHSYVKTRKYCSRKCYGNNETNLKKLKRMATLPRRKRKTQKKKQYQCVECGIEIGKGSKYCRSCSTYGKRSVRHCVVCDNEFYNVAFKKTCSELCRSKLRSLIQEGEKSHRWQGGKTDKALIFRHSLDYSEWRRAVFNRDDYTCYLCFQKGKRLTAHHILLFSERPEFRLEMWNGITLCRKCHQSIHHKEHFYEQEFLCYTWGLAALQNE